MTKQMASSTSYFLRGRTLSKRILSCDSVTDGAFFPQSDLQMPEEEVGQHGGQQMMMPAGKLSDLIMIHPQLRFGFCKTLFNRPANAAEPDKRRQADAAGGVADIVGVNRFGSQGSLDDQPDFSAGKTVSREGHSSPGEFIGDRSLGALRNPASGTRNSGSDSGQKRTPSPALSPFPKGWFWIAVPRRTCKPFLPSPGASTSKGCRTGRQGSKPPPGASQQQG